MVNTQSQRSCSITAGIVLNCLVSTSAQSMKDAMKVLHIQAGRRFFSTRGASMWMLCLYTGATNSARQCTAIICVVSTYTFTITLLQVLKWSRLCSKQFILNGYIMHVVTCFLWKHFWENKQKKGSLPSERGLQHSWQSNDEEIKPSKLPKSTEPWQLSVWCCSKQS